MTQWIPTQHVHTVNDYNDHSGKNWKWERKGWYHTWSITDMQSDLPHHVTVHTMLSAEDNVLSFEIFEYIAEHAVDREIAAGEGYKWVHEMHAVIVEELKKLGVDHYSMFLGRG